MDTSSDRGVLYVATRKPQYIEEAFISALSLKRYATTLKAVLFTDIPDHPLCSLGVFNQVRPIRNKPAPTPAGQALISRANALLRTPFKYTLHLDTDTIVRTSELDSLFQELENDVDIGMVEDSADISFTCLHLKRRMFNAGVILFRKTQAVMELLESWRDVSKRNFLASAQKNLPCFAILEHVKDDAIRRRLLRSDQTSLTELLNPEDSLYPVLVKSLDNSWNSRVRKLDSHAGSHNTRILHGRHGTDQGRIAALETAMVELGLEKHLPPRAGENSQKH